MPKRITDIVEVTGMNGNVREFTVADGTQISKGVLLEFTDNRTAQAASAVDTGSPKKCAGIAHTEKEASNGQTTLGAVTDCVALAYASGAIGFGNPITFLIDGYVAQVPMSTSGALLLASGAVIAGYALEDISDDAQGEVRVQL